MDLKILDIASDTDNFRAIKDYTHNSKLKNSVCGDEVKIELIIKNDKIIDFGYQGNSCIYCRASANLLSKISINNKKNELNKICDDAKSYFDGNIKIKEKKKLLLFQKLFNKKNLLRKECILLPFQTLKKIVSN